MDVNYHKQRVPSSDTIAGAITPHSNMNFSDFSVSIMNSSLTELRSSARSMTNLEDRVTYDQLLTLERVFKEANTNDDSGLDIDEFKHAMRAGMGYHLQDKEIEAIFMKVDTNCDLTVDWDEYVSYMLTEFREKDLMNLANLRKPFPNSVHVVPNMGQYQRRHDNIIRLRYQPIITKCSNNLYRSIFHDNGGKYISVSKDGIINFWSMDLNHLRKHKLPPPKSTRKNLGLWVTDFICVPNLNMLAIASTSGTIVFYDLTAYSFREVLTLAKLEICVTCMDYWVDPSCPSKAKLIWGDTRGNIGALIFDNCQSICFLQPTINKQFKSRVEFPDLLKQTTCGVTAVRFPKIHEDLVIELKYYHSLNECFLSCCRGNSTSLFVGDLEGKKATYFSVNKGVQSFAYSRKHNLIVTAGKDSLIRVWNPVVNSSPIIVLQGTKTFILHVFVHEQGEYIISVAQDRDIHVFDMNTQVCIQTIHKKWVQIGPRVVTATFFNTTRQALLLANNKLAICEKGEKDLYSLQLVSHSTPVSHMLYNKLFHQVISGGTDGLVVVWNCETGERAIQFTAHHVYIIGELCTTIEITAMKLDPTLRRLITATQDNFIRIWNHNNGQMIREIPVHDGKEVIDIVCPKQRIMTAGWNRRMCVYIDSVDDDSMHMWKKQHNEDITAFSFRTPHLIASGSHDGDILIWLLETGHVTLRLNAHVSAKPISRLYHQQIHMAQNSGAFKSQQKQILEMKSVYSNEPTRTEVQDTEANSSSSGSDVIDDDEEKSLLKQFMSYNTHRASIAANVPMMTRKVNIEPEENPIALQVPRRGRRLTAVLPQLATIGELPQFNSSEKDSSISIDQSSECVILPPPGSRRSTDSITEMPHKTSARHQSKTVVIDESNENTRNMNQNNTNDEIESRKQDTKSILKQNNETSKLKQFETTSNTVKISSGTTQTVNNKTQNNNNFVDGPQRKLSNVTEEQIKYDEYIRKNESSILQLLFLMERESEKNTATLVSSSTGGWIRFWSVEHTGGLLGQFNAGHHSGESVQSMCVDLDNEYLFTGDSEGYIKMWDITDYCINKSKLYRLHAHYKAVRSQRFPLHQHKGTLNNRLIDQSRFRPPPLATDPDVTWRAPTLLNSFRGHTQAITGISYIDSLERLVTSGIDGSVRMWTIYGEFIGIFDQEVPWKPVEDDSNQLTKMKTQPLLKPSDPNVLSDGNSDNNKKTPKVPKDIQRSGSATTLRVFHKGIRRRWKMVRNVLQLCLYLMRIVRQNNRSKPQGTSQTHFRRPSIVEEPEYQYIVSEDLSLTEVRAELKRIEAQGVTSKILGSTYKSPMNHKPTPQLPKIRQFQTQCDVYCSLPCYDLAPVNTNLAPPATLIEMHERSPILRFQRDARRIRNAVALQGFSKRGMEKRRMSKYNRSRDSATQFSSGLESRKSIFVSPLVKNPNEKLPEIG